MSIPGRGLDFEFKRQYHSRGKQASYKGPLGWSWDFNYNRRLKKSSGSKSVLCLYLFHGVREKADFQEIGYRFKDIYRLSGGEYLPCSGFYNKIIPNPDGTHTLRERHGKKWIFHAFDGSVRQGKLNEIQDRNGNNIRFSYNAQGRLVEVTDTLGRNITLNYDSSGRIIQIQDFAGRRVTYEYDANGNLWKVTSPATDDFPSGKTTTYTYYSGTGHLNHNLISITDPKGQTYLTNAYGSDPLDSATYDKITSQVYGEGTISYNYDPRNRKTTVTDRNGNIEEWEYSLQGNPTFRKEFTNRDIRPADPDFFLTTFEHNTDYECTLITHPEGNKIRKTYDQNNPDIYNRGNLLEIRRITKPGDASPDIVSTFTYEPNFNFIQTATDPKENTTTYSYDSNGNLTSIQYPVVTLPGPSQTIIEEFAYNAFGQVTDYTRPKGNIIHYEYYSSGLLNGYLWKTIFDYAVDGLNLTTEYAYDLVGNITAITDPNGNTTTYEVNNLDQLTKTIAPTPFSYEIKYTYDANNNLQQIDVQNVDKDGNIIADNPWLTTAYTYNILNYIASKTEEVDQNTNVTTHYYYDSNDNLDLVINPENNKILFAFDERNLIYLIRRGRLMPELITVGIFNYDCNRNLETFEDGRGYITTCNYDCFDRHIETIDALGGIFYKFYDANSNIIQTKFEGPLNHSTPGNIRLQETFYDYDEINRNYQIKRAFYDPATQTNYQDGWQTSQYFYDENSLLFKVLDDKSHQTLYEYDNAERLKKTIDHLTNEIEIIYDANSNIIKKIELEKSQSGNPDEIFNTYFVSDEINRLRQITDNIGNSRQYFYDSRDNLVYLTDAKLNTITNTYDGLNRLIQRSYDQSGITLTKTWDRNSRLASQTDNNGNTLAYSYDALDRCTAVYYADSTWIYYKYDNNNNITNFTDQNFSAIINTYDALNRLTNRSIGRAPCVGGTTWETYGYDGLSRITLAQDDDSEVNLRYDSLGNLRTDRQINGITGDWTVSYNYDSLGNCARITYPSGRVFKQGFDELNRVRNSLVDGSPISCFYYAGPGLRKETSYDYEGGFVKAATTYQFDGIKRIIDIAARVDQYPFSIFAQFCYGYDQENNRLYEQKTHSPWNGKGDRFGYDSIYEVIQGKLGIDDPVNDTGSVQTLIDYHFDGVGNRTQVITNGFPENYIMDNTSPEPADYQVNQYTNVGGAPYAYDKNGNITYDGKRDFNYTYDYRNQLIEVKDAATGNSKAEYSYDALGRRFRRVTFDEWGTPHCHKFVLSKPGVETIPREIQTYDEIYYVNELKTEYYYDYTPNIGKVLCMSQYEEPYQGNYYFYENALGSITHVAFFTPSFEVKEKYDYDPFGNVTIRDGFDNLRDESAIGNTFMFAGCRRDPETGLYYFQARYYDPLIGRYISRDPIGIWTDKMNLGNGFTYCGNNPVNRKDPSGLQQDAPPQEQDKPPLGEGRDLDGATVMCPFLQVEYPPQEQDKPPQVDTWRRIRIFETQVKMIDVNINKYKGLIESIPWYHKVLSPVETAMIEAGLRQDIHRLEKEKEETLKKIHELAEQVEGEIPPERDEEFDEEGDPY